MRMTKEVDISTLKAQFEVHFQVGIRYLLLDFTLYHFLVDGTESEELYYDFSIIHDNKEKQIIVGGKVMEIDNILPYKYDILESVAFKGDNLITTYQNPDVE